MDHRLFQRGQWTLRLRERWSQISQRIMAFVAPVAAARACDMDGDATLEPTPRAWRAWRRDADPHRRNSRPLPVTTQRNTCAGRARASSRPEPVSLGDGERPRLRAQRAGRLERRHPQGVHWLEGPCGRHIHHRQDRLGHGRASHRAAQRHARGLPHDRRRRQLEQGRARPVQLLPAQRAPDDLRQRAGWLGARQPLGDHQRPPRRPLPHHRRRRRTGHATRPPSAARCSS